MSPAVGKPVAPRTPVAGRAGAPARPAAAWRDPPPPPSDAPVKRLERMAAAFLVGAILGMFALFFSFASQNVAVLVVAIVAVVGFGIAAAILAYKAKLARTAFWKAFAASRGWTYVERDDADRPQRFLGFHPFGAGHSRRALNVIGGSWQTTPFEVFTYTWTVSSGSGKNRRSHTYYAKVGATPMPMHAPDLVISPETFGKKLWDALGGEDIDTESDEFSRAFWVKCGDRRFAYDVLHGPMMDHLLAVGRTGSWQWRGSWLLRVHEGRLGPGEVDALAASLHGYVTNLPRHRLAATGDNASTPASRRDHAGVAPARAAGLKTATPSRRP